MSADAVTRLAAESAGEVVAGRVDDSDRDVTPGELDWEAEIAVVGDDDRRVHLAGQDVDQEVRGDVERQSPSPRGGRRTP